MSTKSGEVNVHETDPLDTLILQATDSIAEYANSIQKKLQTRRIMRGWRNWGIASQAWGYITTLNPHGGPSFPGIFPRRLIKLRRPWPESKGERGDSSKKK